MWMNFRLPKNSISFLNIINKSLVNHTIGKHLRHIATNSTHYDIIIAGGGLVGTTLACTLGKNSKLSEKKILLLDSGKNFEWKFQEEYSNRVSALNPQTFDLFNEIEAWSYIAKTRYGLIKKMQVWDGVSNAMITFNNRDLTEIIAYIVENDLILTSIGNELKKLKNITKLNEAKVKKYILPKTDEDILQLEMADGTFYTCELLLGCDGANSQVRKSMNVNYMSWKYNHKGVVATLKLSEPTENTVAWQRLLPTGAIALLPLNKELSSLVWTLPDQEADDVLQLTEEKFVDAINNAFWKTYECNSIIQDATRGFSKLLESFDLPSNDLRQLPPKIIGVIGNRAAFPLGFGHAANYVERGVALVGDAAHRVHPLAGQGVNLGYGDVISLNKILSEAIYSGNRLNSMLYLKQYESERQRHNVPMMIAIDGLHKITSTEFMPIVLLRSLGLQFTHAVNPIKRAIIGFAAY